MKKLFIFSAIILRLTVALQAQDKIFQSDGTKIEGKVIEISESRIKYKKFNMPPDSPVYSLSKNEVLMVVYENGSHEVFKTEDAAVSSEPAAEPAFQRRRVMGFDLFQHYYGNVAWFIERVKSPLYAMRFTMYFNYRNEKDREGFPIEYGFSVFPKFHVYNNDYVHLFLGPSFHHGASRKEVTTNHYGYSSGYGYEPYRYSETNTYWAVHSLTMLETGISINPVKQLDISFQGGVGLLSTGSDGPDGFTGSYDLGWKVGMSIGGKF